jgi:hypothetical protein
VGVCYSVVRVLHEEFGRHGLQVGVCYSVVRVLHEEFGRHGLQARAKATFPHTLTVGVWRAGRRENLRTAAAGER